MPPSEPRGGAHRETSSPPGAPASYDREAFANRARLYQWQAKKHAARAALARDAGHVETWREDSTQARIFAADARSHLAVLIEYP